MSTKEFFARLFIGMIVFIFGVVVWALGPYLQGDALKFGLDAPIVSMFLGKAKAKGVTATLLLASRGALMMTLVSWIILPVLNFFAYADFRPLERASMLLFMLISVCCFIGALVWHFLYNV